MMHHPSFRSIRAALSAALTVCLAAAALPAAASSHREAPGITQYPKLDGTDLYVFRSYEPGRSDFVTIIANYLPLQDSYGGPNYFTLDPDGVYEIHIDNNGDAREDLTYQFKFQYDLKNIELPIGGQRVAIPLRNAGQIAAGDASARNDAETYTVSQINGARRQPAGVVGKLANATGGANQFAKPIDNIGNKSIPDYAAYANSHIYTVTLPGCPMPGRLFVGQRKEGFGVNLGEIFDLVNLPASRVIGSRSGGSNATADKNVTSLALELPIACVTHGDAVIGVWTTASLPRSRLVGNEPLRQIILDRNLVQVSRLGMPLVNEIVIGLKDKDKFNASEPKDDGQFATYVTNPSLPALVEILFGSAGVRAPSVFPRTDLVAAFLTGVPGVNQARNGVASEMIRLNTALPVTPKGSQNSLGAAACFVAGALTLSNPGCDPAGFPNGRRPGDDVVDIELRVAMGVLLPPGSGKPASADLPYTDGVLVEDAQFDNAFPYLTTPLPGSPNGSNGLPSNPPTP
ncbi:DUF4331 domain-containing protein [Tahibacter soli]|uniref:DUF4331 domain-containing protein n=1 Tax=Tahibacter soli TaxID=2983605 RepID=A0A9X3YIE2_9GAMM|nr:DUF4331 domain-containing protein [Tahibacter soli]MDC8012817.1 DUF4331 domain-containing protein [Tahibacter soli]